MEWVELWLDGPKGKGFLTFDTGTSGDWIRLDVQDVVGWPATILLDQWVGQVEPSERERIRRAVTGE